MSEFAVSLEIDAPASLTWSLLADWRAHGRWIPLTTVVVHDPAASADRAGARADTGAVSSPVDPASEGLGTRFTGRTGIGPLAFDDPMEVVAWSPPAGDGPDDEPGHCAVVKQGRLLMGRAWFDVEPLAGGRCRVTWHEDLKVTPVRLTRRVSPVIDLLGRSGFAIVLHALARDARHAAGRAA